MSKLVNLVWWCVTLLLLSTASLWARDVSAYQSPDLSTYFETLMEPDNPGVRCCGEGDAYYADRVEPCGPGDPMDCALVAVITDTRPDKIVVHGPAGTVLNTIDRLHIAPGTRVAIPRAKLRRPAVPNPTGRTIVFLTAMPDLFVTCYEPGSGM